MMFYNYLSHFIFLSWASASTYVLGPRQEQNGTIAWTSCPPEIEAAATSPVQCYNMTVPLDYTSPDSTATHTLELIRVPVVNGTSRGTVITNFGGPGAEGLLNLAQSAALYLYNLTNNEFDWVSFNPRGTSQTFLPYSCYDSALERTLAINSRGIAIDASDASPGLQWAESASLADGCRQRYEDTGEFFGTAFVARDVMQIVDALEQGPLLNYYGPSYGTILGATLAAMFPERMGNVILDGVVNAHEFYNSFGFLSECVNAGPDRCALASTNSSASELEETVRDWVEALRLDPIPLPYSLVNAESGGLQRVVDYSGVKGLILTVLYQPVAFPALATAIDGAMNNNFTELASLRDTFSDIFATVVQNEATFGVRCSDKWRRTNDRQELAPILEEAGQISWVGGYLSIPGVAVPCALWPFQAAERYNGTFNVETANPMLIIGNTLDPVTPLVSARNMSAGFEGSVVLERGGFGHTSLTQDSACLYRAVVEYYTTGTLPEDGTICEPDAGPFDV